MDTLRADHLEWYGYERATMPELRPLVERGALFESAYTTLPETTPAISSMLTSLYPARHGVERLYLRLHESNLTAATLLRRQGYATAAFVSSFVMIRDFSNFAPGFDVYDDFVTERERYRENYERRAGPTLALARAWIEGHRHGPFFCFIHLIDPHGPYTPPGAFAERFHSTTVEPVEGTIPPYQQIPGVRDRNRYRDLYDGEIAYASAELGRFFAYLRRAGLFDRALILFSADHGEEMGEHGYNFRHGCDIYQQNVHVPLIVKPPAATPARLPRRIAQPVSVVDLLPTALALLGLPRPAGLQGRSLAALATGRAPAADGAPAVFFELHEGAPLFGEVRGSRKTILAGGRIAQYDLAADPAERQPLAAPRFDAHGAAELRAWQRANESWHRAFTVEDNGMAYAQRGAFIRTRGAGPALSASDVQRLRSLGYL